MTTVHAGDSGPILAIDLGGTLIRVAHLSSDLTVAHREVIPTMATLGVESILDRMISTAHAVQAAAETAGRPAPTAIGVSCPGPLDPQRGMVHQPPNLPGWDEVPLADRLADALGVPAFLERDTKVAMLAEWRHGAAVGAQHAVYITVSTGIGGAIVVNGRLVDGPDATAGEVGHLTVDLDGPPDGEGAQGHLEGLASGAALARDGAILLDRGQAPRLADLVSSGTPLDAAAVCAAADAGDAACRSLLDRAWSAIGATCAGLVNLLNPEVIVLGGAIADHRPDLHDAVGAEIANRAFPLPGARVQVRPSRFGENVSLVGCWPLIYDTEARS
ncbi:MAG TPA: ROK family protein [Candidatus Limnocylindria bacterium]|nr:ROK family protein [Candidatus Limnocylindria bacterium]